MTFNHSNAVLDILVRSSMSKITKINFHRLHDRKIGPILPDLPDQNKNQALLLKNLLQLTMRFLDGFSKDNLRRTNY